MLFRSEERETEGGEEERKQVCHGEGGEGVRERERESGAEEERWAVAGVFSSLTCPAHWVIAGGGGEHLGRKVLEGHDLSVVLHDGLQIESTLFIAERLRSRQDNETDTNTHTRKTAHHSHLAETSLNIT